MAQQVQIGPVPWHLQWFDTPNVSARLWGLVIGLITIGIIGLIGGFYSTMALFGLSIFLLLGAGMIIAGFGKQIKAANPTEVGVLTIFGRRRNILLKEGFPLLAPYWPLLIDVETVSIESYTSKADWIDVSTKGEKTTHSKSSVGALARVSVELLLEPDYKAKDGKADVGAERINNYINRGGAKNAITVILNKIEEAVRSVALEYDWEDFIALKKPLSAYLITLVANTKLRRLRDAGADIPTTVELAAKGITLESYEEGAPTEYEDDVLDYLRRSEDAAEYKRRLKEIEYFLKAAATNGTGDVPDLGIKIIILNVTSIESTGLAKTAADKASAEKKEREAETADFTTERMLIRAYIEDSKTPDGKPTVTYEQAAAWVRVNRKRAVESIVNVTGNGGPLEKAAAVLKGGS